MRIAVLAVLSVALALGPLQGVRAGDTPKDRIAASRVVIGDFAERLKAALVNEMKTNGPVGAIEVCRMTAPAIAADASARTGWEVGRTSLKTRNSDNAPDAWEREILQAFKARRAAGEDPAKMDAWTVVESEGDRQFRYMKAIPTASLCLTCHGTDIDPSVRKALEDAYPGDKATGYSEGDVRGAFTIVQPM